MRLKIKEFEIGPIAYFGPQIVRYFKNLTGMFCFSPRKIWENWLWRWCPLVPVSTIHSLDHFHKAVEIFLMKFDQRVQIGFHHIDQNPVHSMLRAYLDKKVMVRGKKTSTAWKGIKCPQSPQFVSPKNLCILNKSFKNWYFTYQTTHSKQG